MRLHYALIAGLTLAPIGPLRGQSAQTCLATAQAPDSATRAALIQAREAVWRAYFAGDSVQLVELLPERMVGMGNDRAGIIAGAQRFARGGGRLVSLTFACDEFFVAGTVAVVFSHYDAELDDNGTHRSMVGRAIEVFERRPGRWLNPSWHLDGDK